LKGYAGLPEKRKKELYGVAIIADAVARAMAFAIEQPKDVDINDIVLRPAA
jgi:NADP-dependent 3-hydroxy acid dehydrogenase YdfG